jgi:hypothetical protein
MRAAAPLTVVAVALAAGAGVSACGGSGYQYVENDDLGIYARLPDDWAVYDESELFPEESDSQIERRARQSWVRTFDAASDPSAEGSQGFGEESPTGVMLVRVLSRQEREQLDLSALRGAGNPDLDPVAAASSGGAGGGDVTVLADEPVEYDGGFTGVHTVFVVEQPGDAVVIDQVAVRNAETTAIAVFRLSCNEQCYEDTHHDEIADVVESWTIQEVR